jgi:hypothetical protein
LSPSDGEEKQATERIVVKLVDSGW